MGLWYIYYIVLQASINNIKSLAKFAMMTDSFGFKHKSGMLTAVSSLPSEWGIGTFGAPCKRFVDFLSATRTKCWQILPLNPTAYGDSPYQSPASFAGNHYYIDPQTLFKKGLLDGEDLKSAVHVCDKTDYGWLFENKTALLKKAYSHFLPDCEFETFCKDNAKWLDDYAYFMALKAAFGYKAWNEWEDEFRFYDKAQARKEEFASEIAFWKFVQYEFFAEWQDVLNYAHSKNITIVGDMPIYVAYDSADVWSNPSMFLLDEDLNPTVVAGCPPDAYAEDGQLWGNPIYNYDKMKADGYEWWIERIEQSFKLYDILRIDHFRGFAGYFVIKNGEKTAKDGKWMVGPGKSLFDEVNRRIPGAKIIAEDLGFITDDVRELLAYCGYPGMKVLQFAFSNDDNEYLPRTYKDENCVVYTGSHDADCTTSWCKKLKGDTLARFKKECLRFCGGANRTYAMINLAFQSVANLAVVPLQDWLLLTNEQGRMNTPSVAQGNWVWRAPSNYDNPELIDRIRKTNERFKREN